MSRSSTPIRPFPSWLRPFYFEIMAGLLAFLLLLLPIALWLQVFCAGSTICFPDVR